MTGTKPKVEKVRECLEAALAAREVYEAALLALETELGGVELENLSDHGTEGALNFDAETLIEMAAQEAL